MAEISIISEELEPIEDGLKLNDLDSYNEAIEFQPICGCLEYLGRSGRTYNYRGSANGCVIAYFSRNGRVTSSMRQIVYGGNTYNFTPLAGESLGFGCC